MNEIQGTYEPPAITELGSVYELTLGGCGVVSRDGTFNGSVCNPVSDLLDELGIGH